MKNSKALMDKAGITPRLRLGIKREKGGVESTGPQRVRLVDDRLVKDLDPQTGEQIEYVEYKLLHNGEEKIYRTKVHDKDGGLSYLVQRMSEIKEGAEVIMELKKAGVKNYIHVTEVDYGEEIHENGDDHGEPDMPPNLEE